jgi:hypothetical protein
MADHSGRKKVTLANHFRFGISTFDPTEEWSNLPAQVEGQKEPAGCAGSGAPGMAISRGHAVCQK